MAAQNIIQSLGTNPQTIFKEQSRTLLLTVFDISKDPIDLTGATILMTVRKTFTSTPVISKTSDVPAQIAILPQSGTTLGQAHIFIVPDDTDPLTAGDYIYDVWVILPSGFQTIVIEPSKFQILNAVTNPP